MRKLWIGLILAAVLFAASTPQLYVKIGTKTYWYTLGQSFKITNGVLDVVFPPSSQAPKRVFNYVVPCTDATCTIPAGATDVEVYINRILALPGVDVTIDGTSLNPANMIAQPYSDSLIVIHYTPGSL